jgi:hypothetical protein
VSALPLSLPLVDRARAEVAALIAAEESIAEDLRVLCARLWQLGSTLCQLKEGVGHNNWMFFVDSNFPDLCNTGDPIKRPSHRVKRACEAMAFYRENPNFPSSGNFTLESVRKCVFHLAPEKKREELPGNEKITSKPHQLGYVNQFFKWSRQVEIGLIERPAQDTLRRDLEPLIKRIAELTGPEWVAGLLA